MKTKFLKTAIVAIIFVPLMSMAQSPIEKLYTKYAGQDNFTSVNINKELFQMIMKMDIQGEGTEEVKEIQKMMDQLDGLKILSYHDSTNKAKVSAIYKEFNDLFPAPPYSELMSIKENGNNVRFLTKQDTGGKILELVMLADDDGEVTVLSLVGRIDMSTISKLSKKINIDGMEKLDHIKGKHPTKK
ncbi:MAG: DUF4252 domain-containing protein [bacterium]